MIGSALRALAPAALAASLFLLPGAAAQGVSHHGEMQARSGASVRQSPQRVRTSFDMSGPRVSSRISREDLTQRAVPIPAPVQGISQQRAPQDLASADQPRVRVLGTDGAQSVASVRQSRAAERERREREESQEPSRAEASGQPLPSYIQYNSSTTSTFDFSVPPPVGGVVCDGLPVGVDRFTHDGTTYYAYAGSCLTRIYQGGVVCYRVVPCPGN